MRRSRQILLTILITLALLALSWSAGTGIRREKTVGVLAAGSAIPAGSQLTADMLEIVQIPESILGDCYLGNLAEVEGYWTSSPIDAGELISRSRLSVSATGIRYPDPGPGRRLLTLDLDAADANGFWLSAGSRVDLYLIPVSRENGTEVQIMENIRIMAILSAETGAPLSGSLEETSAAGLVCLDLASEQARLILSSLGLFDIKLTAINEAVPTPVQ